MLQASFGVVPHALLHRWVLADVLDLCPPMPAGSMLAVLATLLAEGGTLPRVLTPPVYWQVDGQDGHECHAWAPQEPN